MKKMFTAVLLLAIAGMTASPVQAQEEKKQELDAFTCISISANSDVFYKQEQGHGIQVKGHPKDVDALVIKLEGDRLVVKYPIGYRAKSKVTIKIKSEELEKLGLSGSGTFAAKSIKSEEIVFGLSGSCDLSIDQLVAEEVGVKISGSADVEIGGGSAEELVASISGSGKIKAENFEVSEAEARTSGSGSIWITVTEELTLRSSGSGSIYYHGNPRVDAVSSGSGKVKAL